ncbi:unnamed protein product [Symbiodinium microadriaticum]|nr:unnamed protein product [Symbiodinium sp. KB8]CAE7872408.1 unnamed protein product [Symbiodinium microadriaticum]
MAAPVSHAPEPVPERKLEILWATSGELLVTLMLPASSLIKDVKVRLQSKLGIDVEMQKLVTEEAVLEDDQPLELDQLRLICLSPEYGLVVVEGTRSRDQRGLGNENVASKTNGLAKALGSSGEVREEGDTTHYHVQLEVVVPETKEQPKFFWTEITSGIGTCTVFSCYVEPGAKVLLALWDEASAPALPAERVWAPVIYPRGPKCTSGFAHGKGQPPRGFLSLNCLRQLRPEDCDWQSVTAPKLYRLYS